MISDILLIASLAALNISNNVLTYSYADDTYLNVYYQKLTTNFADNTSNSCTYVALGMLFSYLDTCYNNSVIADSYLVDSISNAYSNSAALANFLDTSTSTCVSPGIYSSYTDFSKSSKTSVYNFHSQLLSIGNGLGLYDQSPGVSGYGTKDGDGLLIGQTYLNSVLGSVNYYSYYINDRSNRDNIVDFIKTQIQNNRPVVVSSESTSINPADPDNSWGHTYIVFDYEISGGQTILYAHTGWHNPQRIVTFVPNTSSSSYEYPYLCEAYTFKPVYHSHSSNIGINGNFICACKFDDNNSNHYHVYDLKYSQYNSTFHRAYCWCGAAIKEVHSFIVLNNHSVCEFCGYSL